MEPQGIQLPEGWHAQKTGGRPRKDDKFIGIAMARHWLHHVDDQKIYQADKWILEHWSSHGINDDAQIRGIVRRIHKGAAAPLRRCFLFQWEDVTIAIQTFKLANGTSKGWFWRKDMFEAHPMNGAFSLTDGQNGKISFTGDFLSEKPMK